MTKPNYNHITELEHWLNLDHEVERDLAARVAARLRPRPEGRIGRYEVNSEPLELRGDDGRVEFRGGNRNETVDPTGALAPDEPVDPEENRRWRLQGLQQTLVLRSKQALEQGRTKVARQYMEASWEVANQLDQTTVPPPDLNLVELHRNLVKQAKRAEYDQRLTDAKIWWHQAEVIARRILRQQEKR